MDVLDVLRRIRVVRRYAARPIPDDTLTAIVDAGRHAGSSKNLQRWDFIVVTKPETLEALGAVGRYADHLPGAAAAIALVTPDPEDPRAQLSVAWDLGRAAQNIVLAAWAVGIGSSPATVYDHDLARRLLGYPDGRRCPYLIALGYPADPEELTRPARSGGRKTLSEILHLESW
jgi:nitroreductase